MTAAAKPYDFSEFHERTAPDAPEEAYTAADIAAAVESARREALESVAADELAKQTQLLEQIHAQLNTSADARDQALCTHLDGLGDIAREIVKHTCANNSAAENTSKAIALLDRYLSEIPPQTPAALKLPANTADNDLSKLKAAITARGADQLITIATSSEIEPGACRIEWSDGALCHDHGALLSQIDSIFNGAKANRAAPASNKRPTS